MKRTVVRLMQKYLVNPPHVRVSADGRELRGVTVVVQNAELFTYFRQHPIRVVEPSGLDTGSISIGVLKRATVLELLDRHRANRELRQLLLEMIWQGQIAVCAEIALSFALVSSMDSYTRAIGIRAVAAVGGENLKRCLADAMLANVSEWSNREIGEGIVALYQITCRSGSS